MSAWKPYACAIVLQNLLTAADARRKREAWPRHRELVAPLLAAPTVGKEEAMNFLWNRSRQLLILLWKNFLLQVPALYSAL